MQNQTKKKKRQATPPYRAVLEKKWKWANVNTGLFSYDVVIVHVQRKDRGRIFTVPVKRYSLGTATRQEAGEARRNLLDIFLMGSDPHPLGGDTRVFQGNE